MGAAKGKYLSCASRLQAQAGISGLTSQMLVCERKIRDPPVLGHPNFAQEQGLAALAPRIAPVRAEGSKRDKAVIQKCLLITGR